MNADIIAIVTELIATPKKIVIVGHKNPDGDAIGSCLGLGLFLKAKGHEVQVIMPNDFPQFLKWLPGCNELIIHDKAVQESKTAILEADVIFTLDFNALNRSGDAAPFLESSDAQFVMIDHHQQPDDYAVVTYSDANMSSTCEMVYHFIDGLGGLDLLSAEIATLLYTGIMTDTGSFRFPATTPTTHKVAAHLIEAGAEHSRIHEKIYDTNSPDRMRLLGVALKNLIILDDYKVAYISLSQEELDANNFRKGDTEGFVNYALSVQGINFAIIFIENKQENIVKISFRSKGGFSVNEFAITHFNGGGHTNAAGGRSSKGLADTISEFISILPDYKTQI